MDEKSEKRYDRLKKKRDELSAEYHKLKHQHFILSKRHHKMLDALREAVLEVDREVVSLNVTDMMVELTRVKPNGTVGCAGTCTAEECHKCGHFQLMRDKLWLYEHEEESARADCEVVFYDKGV